MSADLIARLESAAEGSRELDFALGLASGKFTESGPCMGERVAGDTTRYVIYTNQATQTVWHGAISACIPHYTTSLDAITALIAEKLPDLKISVDQFQHMGTDGQWCVRFHGPKAFTGYAFKSHAATEPLARCSALLRALQEQGK